MELGHPRRRPRRHAVIPPILIKSLEKQYPEAQGRQHLDEPGRRRTTSCRWPSPTGSSAPDVSQTNEGLQNQGRLVTDKELLPLAPYDKVYHWFARSARCRCSTTRCPPDGKTFGSGTVYGVPETGTVVGIFYNKAL